MPRRRDDCPIGNLDPDEGYDPTAYNPKRRRAYAVGVSYTTQLDSGNRVPLYYPARDKAVVGPDGVKRRSRTLRCKYVSTYGELNAACAELVRDASRYRYVRLRVKTTGNIVDASRTFICCHEIGRNPPFGTETIASIEILSKHESIDA
jgi:hypothetical protein